MGKKMKPKLCMYSNIKTKYINIAFVRYNISFNNKNIKILIRTIWW